MQVHACLWVRRISRGFTSPQPCQMLTPWFDIAKVTNFSLEACVVPSTRITWPFSTSGLDLIGPFKKAKGGFTHIFVAVDKFTKWIKVKPTASITAAKAVEFIRQIMYQFGVINNIITDNGTQFCARVFKDFCVDSGVKINYALVSHP
jgi:hypothetical protein